MKKIPFLLILFLCLGIITSCNDNSFLGGTQITDLDKDAVFADSSYTAGFLTQIYADVGFETKLDRFNGGLQTSCDEAEFKKQSYISADAMFTTGTVNPLTCTSDAWDNCYRNIRRVNVFLKYADKSPMDEDTKVVYKAEARFLRAWYYSILLRHYGGIPLVGDFVAEDVSDIDKLKTSRDSYSDCVDYIINECETAAKSLPNKRAGRENGRAGAGACYSLISRVRLFAASKLFKRCLCLHG
ncbi:MAG: RagB/SusD family nutrient uptake outer membrane protein [Bacteroidales bacterium]|nr:RagB/SusD family nutrient uptake outer membrane protein [Bacteroidales bacterium]